MIRWAVAIALLATPAWCQQREYVEALRKARAGDAEAAAETLSGVIRAHPGFARAYVRLAGLAPRKLADSVPHDAFGYFGRAVARAALKDNSGADIDLRKCLELNPGFLPAYSQLVLVAERRGATKEVAAYLAGLPQTSGALYGLGYLHMLRSDSRRSLEYLERAAQTEQRSWDIADAKYFAYYNSNLFPEALDLLKNMLVQAEEEADQEWKGRVLGRSGMIKVDIGDYEEAAEELSAAVAIARDLGNRSGEGTFQSNLAVALLNSGRYSEALAEGRQAVALAREMKNRGREGRDLGTIANIHAETGQYNLAVLEFSQAIEIAREAKDREAEAHHYASLALIHSSLGDSQKALDAVKASIAMADTLANSWLSGRSLRILGSIQRDRGELTQALQSYERALAIARKIGDRPGEALRLAQAGDIDLALGRRASALQRYERAVSLADEMAAPGIQARAMNHLAHWHLQGGSAATSRELFQRAISIAEAAGQPEALWRAHAGIAASLEKTDLAQALQHYAKATAAIESVRGNLVIAEEKAGYLGDKVRVFDRYVQALLAAGRPAEAFRVAEQARARALLELIAESRAGTSKGIDPVLLEGRRDVEARLARLQSRLTAEQAKERTDSARIRTLEQEIARAEAKHLFMRRQIREKHPELAAFENPDPPDVAVVQRQLGPRSLLLEFVVGEGGAHLFAVGPRQFRVFRLPARALAERVESLRAAIAAGPSRARHSDFVNNARSLYDALIAPAGRLLAGKDHLIVVPDGVLRYLPFEVLLSPSGTDGYLIRDFAISYAHSAGVLSAIKQRQRLGVRTAAASLVAFGDPRYPEQQGAAFVAPLKHSRREIEAIARLYSGARAKVYLGSEAAKQNVAALNSPGPGAVVHFSTHAVLNENRPHFSGLVLSDGELLQVYEVFNLELEAGLVILSACETGLGKEVRGEGLTGLTQAFLYAGASSVLVSLWKVDDRSTAELMIAFHRYLREGKLTRAQALRQAQLEMMRGDFAHPYYWAPFIITGDAAA